MLAKRLPFLLAFVLTAIGVVFAQATPGDLQQSDFTAIATKILTYLGFAIAAGLTLIVAYTAAKAGWSAIRGFLKL